VPVVADFTFGEQLLLNLAGPLLTAALVGFIAAYITRRAQERREDHSLRERLVTEVTQAPSRLYLATQHYWRAKRDKLTGDALAARREALDTAYLECRNDGTALEHRLDLLFADPEPSLLMHRAMDLLTVRYFHLVTEGGATEGLRDKNAGPNHADLTAEELAVPQKVLGKYHETLKELVTAVAQRDLRVNR
jgi:hypothetical protein